MKEKGFTTCLIIGFSNCGDHLQLQIFLHYLSAIIRVALIALDMTYCIQPRNTCNYMQLNHNKVSRLEIFGAVLDNW